jgi:flagellar biosynthesis protein
MTSMRRTAVALEYAHAGVPRVTAKGIGPVADRIVETARAAGVAVEENPALAEALSHVELDDEIPEALYRAVAQVILFVLRSSGKLGSREAGPDRTDRPVR